MVRLILFLMGPPGWLVMYLMAREEKARSAPPSSSSQQ